MSFFHGVTAMVAACLFAAVPTTVTGQESPPPTPAIPADSLQQLFTEFQSLQQRVSQVQQQTLEQNPELEARRQEIQEMVNERVMEQNPELAEKMGRLEELQGEAQAAQQAADTARLQQIVQEGRAIQQEFASAQEMAAQSPELQPEIEAFQERIRNEMAEVDPEIPRVLDRMEELATTLQEAQNGGPSGGGGR